MKILRKDTNSREIGGITLDALIIIDIILITIAMIYSLPEDISFYILTYDFIVCIFLLIEWAFDFKKSESKKSFLKQKKNWISLIASIPFEAILPTVIPGISVLRYFRLIKLLRVLVLFNKFMDDVDSFFEKTKLDKIALIIILTVFLFTILLYFYGPSYGLFDDFYFVIVTLTTVGYGDIAPQTFGEKVIAIVLIIIGIFIFSVITAAISSYLTDRLLTRGKRNKLILNELKLIRKENESMKKEIDELKELIKDKQS